MYLHFTEILTLSLMVIAAKSSGLTVNSYVPLSDLCERRIVIVDWLSVKLKTNRSWTLLATWVVPPLLYLATLCAESEGESKVKITSTSSRGEPSRVYVHWRVMLSFSTGYNGLGGVEIKDAACSLRKKKQNCFWESQINNVVYLWSLGERKGASLQQGLLIQHRRARHANHSKFR